MNEGATHAMLACAQAAEILRQLGFTLTYVSMGSEACYYTREDHPAAIRVAAHRMGRTENNRVMMPIFGKVTFGTNQGIVTETTVERTVLFALGQYYYKRLRLDVDA